MSRYTPVDDLMMAIHQQAVKARATRDQPLSRHQINASRKECRAIVGQAIDRLVDAGLLSTLRLTRDGETNDIYWPTGLKIIAPPTDQELNAMSESKTARLIRLITAHGPIDSVALTAKANAEGANIPAKNLAGLLAAGIKAGTVITSRPDKYTIYQMAAEPVAQTSSLPKDDADDGAMPPADPALANRELGNQLSAAQADQQAAERALQTAQADLGRYRDLLDQVASALHCDSIDSIPAVLDRGIAAHESTGRLAMLLHAGEDADLDYFAPFVSETDAITLAMRQVDTGHAERVTLIRVLGEASRSHTVWTPMVTPPIATLGGQEV
ncbi:MAG: hypothetical protein Q8M09_12410 [Pseudomonadota bacterium]|nr:hypothetical protein [Pseudomonadota bacterium]MDP1905029.1 hypothetical protein [Pseudomonadota bacterium]MDP2354271.1 hypothetical protein [Pseudomonadota bacterium]